MAGAGGGRGVCRFLKGSERPEAGCLGECIVEKRASSL